MSLLHRTLQRWCYCAVNAGVPICAKYAREWIMPLEGSDGNALVLCDFTPGSLVQAQADPAIHVAQSLHANELVPTAIVTSYSTWLTTGMTVAQALIALSKAHALFHLER